MRSIVTKQFQMELVKIYTFWITLQFVIVYDCDGKYTFVDLIMLNCTSFWPRFLTNDTYEASFRHFGIGNF